MYTQMEFCDHNLSYENCPILLTERHELQVLYQVSLILYVVLYINDLFGSSMCEKLSI